MPTQLSNLKTTEKKTAGAKGTEYEAAVTEGGTVLFPEEKENSISKNEAREIAKIMRRRRGISGEASALTAGKLSQCPQSRNIVCRITLAIWCRYVLLYNQLNRLLRNYDEILQRGKVAGQQRDN